MDHLLKERFEISRLLAKLLAGNINEEERQRLQAWLDDSPLHAEELNTLREELMTTRHTLEMQRKGADMVNQRWRAFEKQLPGKRFRVLKAWGRYAAILFWPVALALYFWLGQEKVGPVSMVDNSISAGYFKAHLILDDGKQVTLDSTTQLSLQDGADIEAKNKVLTYKNNDSLQSLREKYNTLVIPRGGEYALELADGTRIWLNSETTLKFPVTFSGRERRVEMTGEGYFEVAKDKEHPFIVQVNGVDVKVLGTSFNISAYDEEVVTTLVEGQVQVKTISDSLELNPNQQAAWDGKHLIVKDVDARNYTLWREGIFFFDNARLEDILDALGRWYNVHVFFQNSELKDMCFSVEIKRYEHIETILRRIAQTDKVKFDIKDKTVNVSE